LPVQQHRIKRYYVALSTSGVIGMTREPGSTPVGRKSHPPLLPQREINSDFQALITFIPMVIVYLARHLTVGSYIRLRRIALRRLGKNYYV